MSRATGSTIKPPGVPTPDARNRAVISAERLFWLAALLLYPAYALLTPPFQTPDEPSHLFRAYELSRFTPIGERRGDVSGAHVPEAFVTAAAMELDMTRVHIARYVERAPWSDRWARSTPWDPQGPHVFTHAAALYSPAGYVPQVFAIWMGERIGLPVENVVRLGRLLNGALALSIFALALRLASAGKWAIVFTALMPMTIACATGFGQDGLVISASTLTITLGIRASLRFRWRPAEYVTAALAGTLVAIAKVIYLPLTLVPAWPWPPGRDKRRWWLSSGMLLAIALVGCVLWAYAVRDLVVPARADLPQWSAQLQFALDHPVPAAKAVARGLLDRRLAEQLVGVFAWLNVGPSRVTLICVALALTMLLLSGDPESRALGASRRLWYLTLVAAICLGIAVLFYLIYTPLGGRSAEGMQGRYFLPMLPLTLAAIVPAVRVLPERFGCEYAIVLLMALGNATSLARIVDAFYA